MSKSLGNVVDPVEVIEQYGTDALRFTLATGACGWPALSRVSLHTCSAGPGPQEQEMSSKASAYAGISIHYRQRKRAYHMLSI